MVDPAQRASLGNSRRCLDQEPAKLAKQAPITNSRGNMSGAQHVLQGNMRTERATHSVGTARRVRSPILTPSLGQTASAMLVTRVLTASLVTLVLPASTRPKRDPRRAPCVERGSTPIRRLLPAAGRASVARQARIRMRTGPRRARAVRRTPTRRL